MSKPHYIPSNPLSKGGNNERGNSLSTCPHFSQPHCSFKQSDTTALQKSTHQICHIPTSSPPDKRPPQHSHPPPILTAQNSASHPHRYPIPSSWDNSSIRTIGIRALSIKSSCNSISGVSLCRHACNFSSVFIFI